MIQKVDTANGNVLATFPTPGLYSSSYPAGLAFDGTLLWHNDPMSPSLSQNDSTFQLNLNCQPQQAMKAFGSYVSGLAWDGQYLWSSDNATQRLYKINTSNFSVIDTINAPGGIAPNGLASNGQSLWVANNDQDYIYQIDITQTVTGLPPRLIPGEGKIYPNPAADYIQVVTNAVDFTFSVTDVTGRTVLNGTVKGNQAPINIRELGKGIYFISLSNNMRIKFIKE